MTTFNYADIKSDVVKPFKTAGKVQFQMVTASVIALNSGVGYGQLVADAKEAMDGGLPHRYTKIAERTAPLYRDAIAAMPADAPYKDVFKAVHDMVQTNFRASRDDGKGTIADYEAFLKTGNVAHVQTEAELIAEQESAANDIEKAAEEKAAGKIAKTEADKAKALAAWLNMAPKTIADRLDDAGRLDVAKMVLNAIADADMLETVLQLAADRKIAVLNANAIVERTAAMTADLIAAGLMQEAA